MSDRKSTAKTGTRKASQRRPQERKRRVPSAPEERRLALMEAAIWLSRDLSSLLAGGELKPYVADVLERVAEEHVELTNAAELSRRLAVLAWEVPRTKAKSPRFGKGEKRIAAIVETARNFRRLYLAQMRQTPFGARFSSDDPAAALQDPWPGEDLDDIEAELCRIAGLARVAVSMKGDNSPIGGYRRVPGPRTAEKAAILAYNVLAAGSAASVQPDKNPDRPQSAVRALIREQHADTMPDGTKRDRRGLVD